MVISFDCTSITTSLVIANSKWEIKKVMDTKKTNYSGQIDALCNSYIGCGSPRGFFHVRHHWSDQCLWRFLRRRFLRLCVAIL